MSRSHGRATAQNFPYIVQNLEICMRKPHFLFKLYLFYSFCFMIHTYDVIFALFLAQNFKTKVLTTHKKSTFRKSGQYHSTIHPSMVTGSLTACIKLAPVQEYSLKTVTYNRPPSAGARKL